LKMKDTLSLDQQRKSVKSRFNLEISDPYRFNNTYALLIKKEKAKQLGISNISDLKRHPALRLGLSHEFLKRQDGWGTLSAFYGLLQKPTALEHGLAYQAILEDRSEERRVGKAKS